MKNLIPEPTNRIEISQQAQQEYKYAGKMKFKAGMRLYAFNLLTDTLKELEVTKKAIVLKRTGAPIIKHTALMAENEVYIPALNLKNARKKADKLKTELKLQQDNQQSV